MSNRHDVLIIGAGPYGLSIAAHCRYHGISFRIFGHPLNVWRNHMPEGMYLKSDGFASNLSDPESRFTLRHYCQQAGILYHDTAVPVQLGTFVAYGDIFQQTYVPTLECAQVVSIQKKGGGFEIALGSGELVESTRIVLAVGISHFFHIPAVLEDLPPDRCSHSYAHRNVEQFRGRDVTVIGAGASAMDLAALLHETGARVTVVTRASSIEFMENQGDKERSTIQRLLHPSSGVGPSMKGWLYTNYPHLVYRLPRKTRVALVRSFLGPAAGWTVKKRILGKVQIRYGSHISQACARNGMVYLKLSSKNAGINEHASEHIIAATGYKVNLKALTFLSGDIRSRLVSDGQSPVLSRRFESSVPGMYFVGPAAANTFGPVQRFTFGAEFAARTISNQLIKPRPGR